MKAVLASFFFFMGLVSFNNQTFGQESQGGKLPRPEPKKSNPIEEAKKRFEEKVRTKEIDEIDKAVPGGFDADKKLTKPAVDIKSTLKKSYCHSYLSTPFNPLVYAESSGLYMMVRTEDLGKGKYRYNLMQVDMMEENFLRDPSKGVSASQVFSLDGPFDLVIMPHGTPPAGFTALSLSSDNGGCGRGKGIGVTIPVRSSGDKLKKPARTLPSDYYSVVDTIGGRLFSVYDKDQVKSLDPFSLQARTVFSFTEGQIPLYWDPDRKHLYAWYVEPHGQLVRMVGTATNIIGRLKLNPGEKIVQDKEKFGLMKLNVAKNSLSLAEVKSWSGTERTSSYSVTLPSLAAVGEASVVPNFAERLLLVYGGTPRAKQSWSSIYLYSYERRSLLTTLTLGDEEYADAALFSPDGKVAIVLIADKKSRLHKSLNLYVMAKRKWVDIPLQKKAAN